MAFETCICGHGPLLHKLVTSVASSCAYRFYGIGEMGCGCSNYKLDNLKLIEDIAKKKGLVK